MKYILEKGSVAVDGVSLTVAKEEIHLYDFPYSPYRKPDGSFY